MSRWARRHLRWLRRAASSTSAATTTPSDTGHSRPGHSVSGGQFGCSPASGTHSGTLRAATTQVSQASGMGACRGMR